MEWCVAWREAWYTVVLTHQYHCISFFWLWRTHTFQTLSARWGMWLHADNQMWWEMLWENPAWPLTILSCTAARRPPVGMAAPPEWCGFDSSAAAGRSCCLEEFPGPRGPRVNRKKNKNLFWVVCYHSIIICPNWCKERIFNLELSWEILLLLGAEYTNYRTKLL